MTAVPPIRVELLKFTPRRKHQHHSVIGYAHISMPEFGMTFFSVRLVTRNGMFIATLPERPCMKGETPARDEFGKMRFLTTAVFHDHERYLEWSRAVVDAVREEHPEAFDNLPAAPIPAAAVQLGA